MVIVLYSLTLVFSSAARAALPDVLPEDKMLGANAVLRSIETAGDVAYALGGVMVFALPLEAPFYIDAVTFLISAAFISGMRIPRHHIPEVRNALGVWQRIREGADFLMSQPFLRWSTFTFALAPIAGGAVFVLVPLYANRALAHSQGLFGPLHSGAFRFSLLEVSLGLGALLGSRVITRIATQWPRGRLFGIGIAGSGITDMALAFVTNVYGAVSLMIVSGVFNTMFVIAGLTLVQQLTPTEMRGRVVAARMTVTNTALALGAAIRSFLLVGMSYRMLWLLEGLVIVVSSLFVWLVKDVRDQV
jgi:hypothetical protein